MYGRRERLYEPPKLNSVGIAYDEAMLQKCMDDVAGMEAEYAGGDHGRTVYAPGANMVGCLAQNVINAYLTERGLPVTAHPFYVPGQRGDAGDFTLHSPQFGNLINDIKATYTTGEPHGNYWCKTKEKTIRPNGYEINFREKKLHHFTFAAVDQNDWKVYVMGVIRFRDFWDDSLPHETIETTMDDGTIVVQRRVRASHLKPLWEYLNFYK